MSLRPRPVTATVTKPSWMEPQAHRRRSYDLESSGSTASLTSVLEHDSYESPEPSDDELETNERLHSQDDKSQVIGETEDRWNREKEKHNATKTIYRKTIKNIKKENDVNRSAWEDWLVTKAKEERQKHRDALKQKKEEKLKQQEEEMKKKETLVKSEKKFMEWKEQKSYEQSLRKKLEKQRIRTEKEIKEEEKRTTKLRAENKLREWNEKKSKQMEEKKVMERQKAHEERQKQQEQKAKAEQSYKKWLKQSKNRPKSAHSSYGYTSGKLTGYHDTGAYPEPAYFNPVPWNFPVFSNKSEHCRAKSAKSRPKKYVWNPDKYF